MTENPCLRFEGWPLLPSRSVIVDQAVLAANLARMQRIAGAARLLPHVKTHKSLLIAQLQRETGAMGFTAALPEEALMLLEAGLGPVTLARPELDSATLAGLIPHAQAGRLRFVVDCDAHVSALSLAVQNGAVQNGEGAERDPIDVLVKIDVGLHRLGIEPDPYRLRLLAGRISVSNGLRYAGILSHAGHSYGAPGLDAIREIALAEVDVMRRLGAAVPVATGHTVISIGATPTLLAGQPLTGITEIRPGNYALMDLTAVSLGLADRDQLAMAVVARVIGLGPDRIVIDIGSKVLSSDRGPHGSDQVSGYGELWLPGADAPLTLTRLSEEHGMTDRVVPGVRVGQRVLVLPNHACPVMNLAGGFTMLPPGDAHPVTPTSPDLARARMGVLRAVPKV